MQNSIHRTKRKSYRMQFKFWLDAAKDCQLELADELERLKHHRLFSRTIRDALRLFLDLKAGKADTLRTMFPAVIERLVSDEIKRREQATALEQFQSILEQAQSRQLEQIKSIVTTSGAAGGVQSGLNLPELDVSIFADEPEPVEPSTARADFAAGFGDLFADDDEDDLWD